MYNKKVLGLAEAEVAVRAIIEEASKEPSRPTVVAVVDDKGDMITLLRMDGALPFFNYMATKKAYTSGILGSDSRKSLELRQKQGWGKYEPVRSDMTVVPGGVAITQSNGASYGGIGVSGRTADEDEALAFVGLKALQNFLWPS